MDQIIARVADRKIQEAIDEGKFDNLPGKGKPLELDDDPMTPPHLRTANRILKNAGVLPDWMQVDIEIDRSREEIRRAWSRLEAEYPRRRARAEAAASADSQRAMDAFARWHTGQRSALLASIRRVNSDITKLNLIAPSVQRVHVPYRLQEEMARFDAAFPPVGGGLPAESEQPAATARGELREAVSLLYRSGRGEPRAR